MKWTECLRLIKSDFYRLCRGGNYIEAYLLEESFKVTLWFRIGTYLQQRRNLLPLYMLIKIIYKHVQHKTGIQLPCGTKVDEGLRFFHHDCIIVAQSVKIGKNVSIHQGVTIGRVFNGKKAGVPIIGDNVVIFAGAKILGNVIIGNGAVIGANAVVINDVPSNSVVAGIPATIISQDSSKCFNKTWGEVFAHSYYE